jgi:hypothetical protein
MAKKSKKAAPKKKAVVKKATPKKPIQQRQNTDYLIGVEKVTVCIPVCRTCNKKLSLPSDKEIAQETADSHANATGHIVELVCSD